MLINSTSKEKLLYSSANAHPFDTYVSTPKALTLAATHIGTQSIKQHAHNQKNSKVIIMRYDKLQRFKKKSSKNKFQGREGKIQAVNILVRLIKTIEHLCHMAQPILFLHIYHKKHWLQIFTTPTLGLHVYIHVQYTAC